jgi:hypothetical protein
MNRKWLGVLLATSVSLAGCANHPIDCGLGFHHTDCLPGTPGYSDPDKFSDSDDKQCRSYGLTYGSPEYADCRVKLSAQHNAGLFD